MHVISTQLGKIEIGEIEPKRDRGSGPFSIALHEIGVGENTWEKASKIPGKLNGINELQRARFSENPLESMNYDKMASRKLQ